MAESGGGRVEKARGVKRPTPPEPLVTVWPCGASTPLGRGSHHRGEMEQRASPLGERCDGCERAQPSADRLTGEITGWLCTGIVRRKEAGQ